MYDDIERFALLEGADMCMRINTGSIVFTERARFKCRSCEKYGKPFCPPNIPEIETFVKMVEEYDYGYLVIKYVKYTSDSDFKEVRESSGKRLHETLLALERYAFDCGYVWVYSFIGGSCRLCGNQGGCTGNGCRKGRPSVEGAGIDVITTLDHNNLALPQFGHPFIDGGEFWRVGLLLVE